MNKLLTMLWLCFGSVLWAQQHDIVDFKTAKVHIGFGNTLQKEVLGTVTYQFDILKQTDSVFLDAHHFTAINYVLDGVISDSLYNGHQLIIKHPFKPNSTHSLVVTFKTSPQKAMYFIDWDYEDGKKQIWTQGQGKYTSNWLPSIDDMNDKIEFDVSVTFHKDYQVIANGNLKNQHINDSTITWHYDMKKPMSSYLVALAIGKYDKKVAHSKSGIPLEMYYYPEDALKFEPTYRYTTQIFDFLEAEIGVPYPWQNYKQVPVKDFLYAGMENTSTTIFSDGFVVDSIAFTDKNYVYVNAHELAHQWFGDLVTETSGTHHWLHEGFATYYALLAEKAIFGDDYYYWQLYEYAQELLAQDQAGQSTLLLDPKSSSTTFYKKGAWVLHMLREHVGDNAFKTAVKNYLTNHQFKNVETNDFISEVEKASGMNLNEFVKIWLESKTFPYEDCLKSLKKNSKEIAQMVELDEELKFSSFSIEDGLNRYWDKAKSSRIRAYLLLKNEINSSHSSIINKAFASKDIKIRQALAQNLKQIPSDFKESYELLLNDPSYTTIESALYNLCVNFPGIRLKYLSKTKDIQGFNNKNIRMLWIALLLNTQEGEDLNAQEFLNELISYTSPKYDSETRQTAFSYLAAMHVFTETVIVNLINATKHHNWQFKTSSKELLDFLSNDDKYRNLIIKLEEKPN